jgi:hypothetical protein
MYRFTSYFPLYNTINDHRGAAKNREDIIFFQKCLDTL